MTIIRDKIELILNNFDREGQDYKFKELYDMVYVLNDLNLEDYDSLEERFDDLFEKYAEHISKYFISVLKMDSVNRFLIERVDFIVPYLSYSDLENIHKIILNIMKTCKNHRSYDWEICDEQLDIIEERQKELIIKIAKPKLIPYLKNNDINILDKILEYF